MAGPSQSKPKGQEKKICCSIFVAFLVATLGVVCFVYSSVIVYKPSWKILQVNCLVSNNLLCNQYFLGKLFNRAKMYHNRNKTPFGGTQSLRQLVFLRRMVQLKKLIALPIFNVQTLKVSQHVGGKLQSRLGVSKKTWKKDHCCF